MPTVPDPTAPPFRSDPVSVPIPKLRPRPWVPARGDVVLYRLYGPFDNLLYIGVTASWAARLRAHWRADGLRPTAATVQRFPSREEAEAAERAAILAERPAFNQIAGTGRFG